MASVGNGAQGLSGGGGLWVERAASIRWEELESSPRSLDLLPHVRGSHGIELFKQKL